MGVALHGNDELEERGTSSKSQNQPVIHHKTYAILFIDFRHSTPISSIRGRNPIDDARLIAALCKAFSQLECVRACTPTFKKSTGDGLMCVWAVDPSGSERAQKLINVLEIAIAINKDSFRSDVMREYGLDCPAIGLGLASGPLAHLDDPPDYFGFAANRAAKLQDRARPGGGLVVDDTYGENQYLEPLRERLLKSGLTYKKVPRASGLGQLGIEGCYISREIRWISPEWTCIAWPGLAATQTRSGSNEQKGSVADGGGLNTKGITVITHEGIQGKLRTLKIWPRDVAQEEGDCIELIVDDLDALTMMQNEDALTLATGGSVSPNVKRRVSGKIHDAFCSDLRWQPGFFFVPIRCGVNALAWNSKAYASFPKKLEKYSEIHQLLKDRAIGPEAIGLYDNLGASLPILLLMSNAHLTIDSVFEAGTEELNACVNMLKTQVNDHRKKFRMYSEAETLANALGRGVIKLVVGGGLWLEPFKGFEVKPEFVLPKLCLPKMDGGFVWIESAAVSVHAKDVDAIVNFLSDNLLTLEYQLGLAARIPYGASPVTSEAIEVILRTQHPKIPIHIETHKIFQNGRSLREHLAIRKCPLKPKLWVSCWQEIVGTCCSKV